MQCVLHVKHLCDAIWQCCSPKDDDDDDDSDTLKEHELGQWKETSNAPINKEMIQYTQVVDIQEEEEELDSQFDPDEAYYFNFERLGILSQSSNLVRNMISSYQMEELINASDHILSSSCTDDLTPREIVFNLNRYTNGIPIITDPVKKKAYIQRYEEHKNAFDRDNRNDKEQATLFIENARDERLPSRSRIKYYQTAIKHTNDIDEKEQLRTEYRDYCNIMKKENKT